VHRLHRADPSGCVSSSVQVWRDGVERSWWIAAAGRIESIREHEQSLEVLRDVYSELLACFPEHAQPIRFVDLRIRQRNGLGPLDDRVPTHQFEVVQEVGPPVDEGAASKSGGYRALSDRRHRDQPGRRAQDGGALRCDRAPASSATARAWMAAAERSSSIRAVGPVDPQSRLFRCDNDGFSQGTAPRSVLRRPSIVWPPPPHRASVGWSSP
jgi:hypothetical protein